jgi:Zn-dependent protease with chaperone function
MATNFFERQRLARRDSQRLVILFGIAVIAIVVAVTAVLMVFLGLGDSGRVAQGKGILFSNWKVIAWTGGLTVAAIAGASLFRTIQLREGGAAVARSLGGTEIPASSRDRHHQRLRNVVEEIAIASGVPVPQIFVLEHEPGINAFAAGLRTTDAAIGVTRGAIEQLSRDELQGVIAHEFSHVLNGDMRLNLRLIGWLAGITFLAVIGRILMRARGRNSGGIVMFGVALLVIGSIGLFCARMIKAGISRKREYLADASAVQFTRQNAGLAGALKKIAAHAHGSTLEATDAEEVSHMMFGDGVGYSKLFATHPPLEERIRALEPGFKLTDLTAWIRQQKSADVRTAAEERRAPLPDLEFTRVLGPAGAAIPAPVIIAGLPAAASAALAPGDVLEQVGSPGADDYRTAGLLHDWLPAAPGAIRQAQLAAVAEKFDARAAQHADALTRLTAALHPMQRLPIAEIAFSSLRRMPAGHLRDTADVVQALVVADRNVSLFEFCLGFLLRQHIDEVLSPRDAKEGRKSLPAVQPAIGLVLSLLADVGHPDDRRAAERAFAAGLAELGQSITLKFDLPLDWSLRLGPALAELDQLGPVAKSMLIAAMTQAMANDGRIDVAEAELLRTTCAALHCPLPPLLHEARTRLAGTPTVD